MCGELVTLKTHRDTTMRYALAQPKSAAVAGEKIALILLPGGGGHADLDDNGCPRALVGNSLHGFADQQADVAASIARFVRGSTY